MANLEVTIAILDKDTYNFDKRAKTNKLKNALDEIVNSKARGAAICSRVKWQTNRGQMHCKILQTSSTSELHNCDLIT